jgi:hypothetical protein
LSPSSNRSFLTLVARQIAQAIQEGRFVADQALPPDRKFAKTFGVSRPHLHFEIWYNDSGNITVHPSTQSTTILCQ